MITDAIIKIFEKDPSVKRHLLKTVSWRIVGTLDTVLLGWFITGQLSLGARIGGMELITKMLLYFLHERFWYKINFGLTSRRVKTEEIK